MPIAIAWTIITVTCMVAVAVWALLASSARRAALKEDAQRRFVLASGAYLLGWVALMFVLASAGAFEATATRMFPALGIGVAVPFGAGYMLLQRSATLNKVLDAVPLPWLIGIQFYRNIGISFLLLYSLGSLPAEFALSGGVGDAVVGLSAPLVAYLVSQGSGWGLAKAWNLIGIVDLVGAVSLGYLTAPGPFQMLAASSPNEMISRYPLVLIPLFLVPLSVLLHLACLARLKPAGR